METSVLGSQNTCHGRGNGSAGNNSMTGLDLAGPQSTSSAVPNSSSSSSASSSNARTSTSSDEMLTTPKFPPESAGLMSPKFTTPKFAHALAAAAAVNMTTTAAAVASSSSSSTSLTTAASTSFGTSATATSSTSVVGGSGSDKDDMLMTPVLTTPRTSDLWPQTASAGGASASGPGGHPGGESGRPGGDHDDQLPITFSPENLTVNSPTPIEVGPREPPKDLPMDSDIGLRSPCDGLLAKRRKFKLKQAVSSNSVNSDSNSCDTPTSQNSPRDLSVVRNGAGGGNEAVDASKVLVKLEFTAAPSNSSDTPFSSKSTLSPTLGGRVGSMAIGNEPRLSPRNFKHPNMKQDGAGRYGNGGDKSSSSSELPSHYTPSPLAVPSPNWSAVERYFGGEMLKTPIQLDTKNVFDFLGPSPHTPRTSKLSSTVRGCPSSPGHDTDRYSGRDQRLSPRLSPRFPIPEAPTDLSSKNSADRLLPPGQSRPDDPPPYPSEAEDLSIASNKQHKTTPAPTASSLPTPVDVHQQLKQEYPPPTPSTELMSNPSRSRNVSGASAASVAALPPEQQNLMPEEMIKAEAPEEYNQSQPQPHNHPHHPHHLHHYRSAPPSVAPTPPPPNSFPPPPHPFYLHPQFHPIYQQQHHRQPLYPETAAAAAAAAAAGVRPHVLTPPPSSRLHSASPHIDTGYGGGAGGAGPVGASDHPAGSGTAYPWMSHVTVQQGEEQQQQLLHRGSPWPSSSRVEPPPHPDDDESSVSPPLYPPQAGLKGVIAVKPQQVLQGAVPGAPGSSMSELLLRHQHVGGDQSGKKRKLGMHSPTSNGGSDGQSLGPKKRTKGKGKKEAANGAGADAGNGNKRVYTCPHCQRSYDWNYNLNRHLKYECGKENAFQCAKCGRKFPHKQNCVYHLKRKHKIVCETIDQYVASGLVLFRGSAGPAGQQTAKPADSGEENQQQPLAGGSSSSGGGMVAATAT